MNTTDLTIKVKKLAANAKLPTKAHPTDAGYDFYCVADASFYNSDGKTLCWLGAGQTIVLKTGIALGLPEGYHLQLKEKSGLAAKGLKVSGGIIDNAYRGEIMVVLTNTSNAPYIIRDGDKICQGVLTKDYPTNIIEVETLDSTERGDKGFGSSGT